MIRSGPSAAARGLNGEGSPAVLVVLNKVEATAELLDAVRRRTAAGATRFFVLVPNPDHAGFDRNSPDSADGEALLTRALAQMQASAKSLVSGRVANGPNAYDDIVAALEDGRYGEIILETPAAHVSHWLHFDLPERVAHLGYPLTTVTAAD